MTKPISPNDISLEKKKYIPDYVIEAFNELIAKNYHDGQSTVKQKDVVALILSKSDDGITRDKIFNEHWLDVEEIYKEAGWRVVYDKPGYCETYDAYFKFKKQGNK